MGFEVQPGTIASEPNEPKAICSDHSARPQAVEGSEVLLPEYRTIHWTYDVEWTRSEIKWSSRWDSYLKMTNVEIHWFSILNSLVIALFLSSFVAAILVRTLTNDIAQYNSSNLEEGQEEETGLLLY